MTRTWLLVHFLLPTIAFADKADNLVAAAMKKWNTPGLSVAVILDGKVVKLKGYGFANIEQNVRVTPETVFQSGSLGKQFTASLVMKLVEDGKLALDDPITKALPNATTAWDKVTVRQLLNHTSGLGNYYPKLDLRKDYTEEELLKIAGEVPVQFQPGEKYSYSNTGYHVLGFLCSKVGGKFYGDQLVNRILRPAGMKTARIISESDIVMQRAAGYTVRDGHLFNQDWVSPTLNTTGDGSLYFSLLDMVSWNAALDGDKVLTPSIKRQMWTSGKLNDGTETGYGFAWDLKPVNGHKQVGHSGAWQGFRTSFMRFPDDKLSVIVLANSDSAYPEQLAKKIATIYVPTLAPKKLIAIPDTMPELTKMLSGFLDGDAENAQKMMTPDLATDITSEWFKGFTAELKSFGSRKQISLVKTKISPDIRQASYRVQYGNQTRIITIAVNSKNLIDGLGVAEEE